MLLQTATFHNFRLLRDATVEFSTDPDRPVTVIRAENESGKTTMLTALQWAFFGDGALPKSAGGKPYRLHPIDWDAAAQPQVDISVEVHFEVTKSATLMFGPSISTTERYWLRRSCVEEVGPGNDGQRVRQDLTLHRVTDDGYAEVKNPTAELEDMLPSALREVFFTDGDRALVFVEAHKDLKRQKVESAIKGLLGVGLMEKAGEHIRAVLAQIRRDVKESAADAELEQVIAAQEQLDRTEQQHRETVLRVDDDALRLGTQIQEYDAKITNALRLGDRAKTAQQLAEAKARLDRSRKALATATQEFSALLQDDALSLALLAPHVARAAEQLGSLKQQGTIPKSFLPILQQRLALGQCICGASLAGGTEAHDHVVALIKRNREQDEVLDRLTTLNVAAARYEDALRGGQGGWTALCSRMFQRRAEAEAELSSAQRAVSELEAQLQRIPESDVGELLRLKHEAEDQKSRLGREKATAEAELRQIEREKQKLAARYEQLTRSKRRFLRQKAFERAARDIQEVVAGTHQVLKTEKLEEVSHEMTQLFLRMIKADPEQQGIIRQAEITPDFDIVVTGPEGFHLDPDVDLNGASRRALTLAFILALTEVSGVTAPNVIDTPLGMTSGEVRRSIFEVAATTASQLVLFLTRDEITGIEDLIDRYAGVELTMTNTAHYPAMLEHDPGTGRLEVLVCHCSHRQTCHVCARKSDVDSVSRLAS